MKIIYLSLLFLVTFLGCQVELYRGLDETEANSVLNELQKNGIEGKKIVTSKRKGLFGIEVSRSDTSKALEILASQDLPKRKHSGFSLVTSGGSLIPSPSERKMKYYIALAGELEQTLEHLPGVQYARVHFAMELGSGSSSYVKKDLSPQKASVIIKYREKEFQLTPKHIQVLVAGALPRLEPDGVSVVIQLAPAIKISSSAYASFGPFSVAPSSRIWLMILFSLFIFGFFLTLVLWLRALKKISRIKGDSLSGSDDTG
jgi:type III secretion protein J